MTHRRRRGARSFRDLVVWQEARAMAQRALAVADRMPRGYGGLADQLRRAATSVPLNIAEGNGRPTRRDYLKYLGQARSSLNEVEAWAELMRGSPTVRRDDIDALTLHVSRTGRLLAALIRSLARSTTVEGPAVEGPAVQSPAVDGPAVEGPAVDRAP